MCGIFGAFNKKIETELAEICLKKLIHRGPDAQGLWQEDGVTLGHRRLSILDLSENGTQPMSYADGRYEIVFNGEIYNFIEIRQELQDKGYCFKSDSDTEVILASYIQWKEGCLNRFNGMWAFSIWDRQEKVMFISRDRFGIKPFFYTEMQEEGYSFAFASEMKALLPLLNEVKANDKLVMNPRQMVRYESTQECVIEGIKRFPAGHYAYVTKSGMRISRFYETLDHLREVPERYEEQVEEFRELFLDACKIRMRSDVTIGTALSGGLDSSATICAMSHIAANHNDVRVNNDWQHAFVAVFPGTTMDESVHARKVTDYLGIQSTFVEIDPLKAIDRLDEFIYMFEDVYLTSPIPMMLLYGELRKQGTLVTIDGHGADELFGGYTFDFIHALKDAQFNKEDMDMVATAYLDSFPSNGSNIALRNKSKNRLYMDYYRKNLTRRIFRPGDIYKPRAAAHPNFEKLDNLNQVLYASAHENILPTLLRNYDRYSMASGVEIRMPFMDYRIVEYAFSIGWKSKLHGGYSKSIIRDAMAPFMPADIAYRKDKIGFNTPIVEWMQGPLKEYFLDTVHSASFAGSGLIHPSQVREKVERVILNKDATFAMGEEAFSSLYPYLWERVMLNNAKDVKKS